MSSISSVSSQYSAPKVSAPPVQRQPVDADGDHDGSKAGEVESKAPPRPVSATVGTRINTTA